MAAGASLEVDAVVNVGLDLFHEVEGQRIEVNLGAELFARALAQAVRGGFAEAERTAWDVPAAAEVRVVAPRQEHRAILSLKPEVDREEWDQARHEQEQLEGQSARMRMAH